MAPMAQRRTTERRLVDVLNHRKAHALCGEGRSCGCANLGFWKRNDVFAMHVLCGHLCFVTTLVGHLRPARPERLPCCGTRRPKKRTTAYRHVRRCNSRNGVRLRHPEGALMGTLRPHHTCGASDRAPTHRALGVGAFGGGANAPEGRCTLLRGESTDRQASPRATGAEHNTEHASTSRPPRTPKHRHRAPCRARNPVSCSVCSSNVVRLSPISKHAPPNFGASTLSHGELNLPGLLARATTCNSCSVHHSPFWAASIQCVTSAPATPSACAA